jgi:hypothetical protein
VARFCRASTHEVRAESTAALDSGAILAIQGWDKQRQVFVDTATTEELQEAVMKAG